MKNYRDLDPIDKEKICLKVDELVRSMADEICAYPSAVANAIFLRVQKNPEWARNPRKAQKNRSYKSHDGKCFFCKEHVPREEAIFHHLERGIPDQHEPTYLVPTHNGCHDVNHGATKASITKGSKSDI